MPHIRDLLQLLAPTALLAAGSAHAEAHRAAQSLPASVRFSLLAPAPRQASTPSRGAHREDARTPQQRLRLSVRAAYYQPASSNRSRLDNRHGDDRHFDNHRIDDRRGRDDMEEAREREGHRFGHHGHYGSAGG